MGYTHYWKTTEPLKVLAPQMKLLKEILKDHKDILHSWDGTGKPELTGNLISFNGDALMGADHETFRIDFGRKEEFAFCKTAQKLYDLAVCKCLLVLSLSKGFSFTSDGDLNDWQEAIKWFAAKGFQDTLDKKVLPVLQR